MADRVTLWRRKHSYTMFDDPPGSPGSWQTGIKPHPSEIEHAVFVPASELDALRATLDEMRAGVGNEVAYLREVASFAETTQMENVCAQSIYRLSELIGQT